MTGSAQSKRRELDTLASYLAHPRAVDPLILGPLPTKGARQRRSMQDLLWVQVDSVTGAGRVLSTKPVPVNSAMRTIQPQDQEVARIEALGARIVDDRRGATPGGWVVMADLEGNEFCVEGGE
jgi:hypothetical protein